MASIATGSRARFWIAPTIGGALFAIAIGLSTGLPGNPSFEVMPPWLHTVAELWAITIAIMTFTVVWNARLSERPGRMAILACGFLATGLIDAGHMMSFRGMPDFVTPAGAEKAINFWLCARLIQASTLVAAVFVEWKPLAQRSSRAFMLAGTLAAVSGVYVVTLFHPEFWPRTFVAGSGLTPFKIGCEYLIISLLAATAVACYRRSIRSGSGEYLAIASAAAISILSELCFTMYLSVNDAINLLGHLYKIAAFYFFYRAVFATCIAAPFERITEEIAERRRANLALQYSERLSRELGANLPELLAVREARGERLLYASPAWDRIFGPGTSSRRTLSELMRSLHPDDARVLASVAEDYPEGGYEGTVRLTGQDGTLRSIYLRTFPIRDDTGSVYRVAAIGTDMTDRERIARALSESEDRLSEAVRVTHLGIFDHDHVTGRIYWSAEQRRIYGWPEDEPVTLPAFVACVHPDERERVAAAVAAAHDPDGDGRFELEHRIVRRDDGAVRRLATQSQTQFAGEGTARRAVRTVGAVLDITDRRRMELALEESAARLRAAVEVTELGIFDHDHLTDAIHYSPELRRIMGLTSDEPATLARHLDSIHPDDRTRLARAIADAHDPDGDGRYQAERRLVRADGSVRWVSARSLTEFSGEGADRRPRRTVGAILDITDQHDMAAELQVLNRDLEARVHQRTMELRAANAELEAFGYSVSHDLRAPLRHIVGYLDLLRRELPSSTNSEVGRHMAVIGDAAVRMGAMIDSLLDFSRIGRVALAVADVDVAEMVDHVREELSHGCAKRRIDWSIGALPRAEADPTLLRMVWTNLLSNAIKFTGGRERARIEVGCREGADPSSASVYYVRDDGAGFDMRYADKLFGVSQRLHRREEFEGTGIGLANCKRIVERHGGRIWVESAPGAGTTFYFMLGRSERREKT